MQVEFVGVMGSSGWLEVFGIDMGVEVFEQLVGGALLLASEALDAGWADVDGDLLALHQGILHSRHVNKIITHALYIVCRSI